MLCVLDFTAFICGILLLVQSSESMDIINGKEVKDHSMSYMALLHNDKKPLCGGILIHQSWVLTAAHCTGINKVWLGMLSIKADEKNRQIRTVKKRYPHLCFDPKEKVNDIMLLKLDKAVKETDTVKVLKLNESPKEPASGTKCTVAGWGQTVSNVAGMSDVLRSATVTVVSRRTCNSPDYYNYNPVITKGMICAGSLGKNIADTCKGDSGGPLLCNGDLVGITSFGRNCSLVNKPGVYTFLSAKQYSWVTQTMRKSDV